MIDRPLNIHPDIWNFRNTNKQQQSQPKQIQLDQFTKLYNSVDMIIQGLYNFKNNFQNIDFDQYEQQQKSTMFQINNIVDKALIPYSIDIVKQLNKLGQDKLKNEQK